jgi:hypothetical protein
MEFQLIDQLQVDWAALPRLALAGFLLVVGLGGGLHWAKEALFEPRFVPPPSFSSSPQ